MNKVTAQHDEQWEVVVIGGGPAGMMAAGRAAELGKRVILLEKNSRLGEKLLITGGGRSNITNNEPNIRNFVSKFADRAQFLFSPFSQFSVPQTLEFFHTHGMETKIEAEGRVFPATEKAETVQRTMIAYMKKHGVTIHTNAEVAGFKDKKGTIIGVQLSNGTLISGRSYIISTGGLSHPETGSTGDGFRWLKDLGHTIGKHDAALVPLRTKESWSHTCSGLSFPSAKVTLFIDGKKHFSKIGKLLFTHFGLSGPLILNMSKTVRDSMQEGIVTLGIDLFPDENTETMDKRLQNMITTEPNKKTKNILTEIIPATLADALLKLCSIDTEKPAHSLSRSERIMLGQTLKRILLTPNGFLGASHAIITAGGVPLEEIDTRTMRSKIHPELFLVGDILDINRPSGGYSLQLCWTTGWVSGSHS